MLGVGWEVEEVPSAEVVPRAVVVAADVSTEAGAADMATAAPLHVAAENGKLACVRLLVAWGADPVAADGDQDPKPSGRSRGASSRHGCESFGCQVCWPNGRRARRNAEIEQPREQR